MSRTNRDYKGDGAGKEYWKSRLHRHGEVPGRFTKRLTSKKDRQENKIDYDEFVNTNEDNEILDD